MARHGRRRTPWIIHKPVRWLSAVAAGAAAGAVVSLTGAVPDESPTPAGASTSDLRGSDSAAGGPALDVKPSIGRGAACAPELAGAANPTRSVEGAAGYAFASVTQDCDRVIISVMAVDGNAFAPVQVPSDEYFSDVAVTGDSGSFAIEATLGRLPQGSFSVPFTVPVVSLDDGPESLPQLKAMTLQLYTDNKKQTRVTGLEAVGAERSVTVVKPHISPSRSTGQTLGG